MVKPSSRVDALLDELCVDYGYCGFIDSEKYEALLANLPADPDGFVDAVLLAEGYSLSTVDKHERQFLRERVSDWLFDDGRGRGTKSGLPRVPPVIE